MFLVWTLGKDNGWCTSIEVLLTGESKTHGSYQMKLFWILRFCLLESARYRPSTLNHDELEAFLRDDFLELMKTNLKIRLWRIDTGECFDLVWQARRLIKWDSLQFCAAVSPDIAMELEADYRNYSWNHHQPLCTTLSMFVSVCM